MKKLLVCFSLIFMLTPMFGACQFHSEKIKVHSLDYASLAYLEPGEFDADQSAVWYLPENPYREYACSVSVSNGMLLISNDSQERKTYLTQFDNGYFVGVDLGEFDGWVKYYPYYSTLPEAGEPKQVSDQNCRGIITKDRRNGYLLTGDTGGTSGVYQGSIYTLHYSEEEARWEWDLLETLDELPLAYSYDRERDMLYVATSGSVISVSGDNTVTVMVSSDLLKSIGANSVVFWEGSVWCGSPMGVYQYNIGEKKETWYPMDYQKIIK